MLSPKDFSGAPKQKVDELPQSVAEDFSSVAGLVNSRFNRAKIARQQEQELIWLDAYRAWRGQNSPSEQAQLDKARERMQAASGVFIKITKTKATAAYGQVCEILFANNKFPLGVEPTDKPKGLDSIDTIVPQGQQYGQDTQDQPDAYGFKGDGRQIPPGATSTSLVMSLKETWKNLMSTTKLTPGASPDVSKLSEIHPAQRAAVNLEKVMHTQLEIGKGEKILRRATYDCVIYGTGIIKGPFSYNEITPNWVLNDDGSIDYQPTSKLVPKFSHVPVWNLYPDPDAETVDECEYMIERHLLSRNQLKMLANRPKFNVDAINELLLEIPTHQTEFWEQQIGKYRAATPNHKYEVLEYWGNVDKEMLDSVGVDTTNVDLNVVQVNVWICRDRILRVVLNPFLPTHMPYHVVTYEEHPHRIWGIGVPENMADTQMLMNGHYRMMVDNLRLAGNLVFEVNESQLVPGQDFTIFPGKVFRKQGGAPGQSLFGLTFPNTAQAHLQAFDKARMLSDEATGIPSIAHGQSGVTGQTRTASGISMMMSAAAMNVKTVASNFDQLITSMGNALFRWNMQFNNEDKEIRGNLKIVAKGTASLMQREVVTQRLLSLLQVGANPAVAPFLKMNAIISEIVRNMDLDGDKYVNSPEEAKLFAASMSQMMGGSSQGGSPQGGSPQGGQAPQNPMSQQGSSPIGGSGPSPSDTTGGGNGQMAPSSPSAPSMGQ